MNSKQQEKSTFLLSLASYMGGIRESWRRIRRESVKRPPQTKVAMIDPTVGNMLVCKDTGGDNDNELLNDPPVDQREKANYNLSSFDKFLRSLPKSDSVDRTVDWVLSQPDNIEEREPDRFGNLSNNRLKRQTRGHNMTHHLHATTNDELMGCNMEHETISSQVSWSRYESERGTVGRGTPPIHRDGHQRLDLLLQQMYRQQERSVQIEQQQKHCGDECLIDGMRMCGWGECQVTTHTRRQLMTHVTQHIHAGGPTGDQKLWWCRWRGCGLFGRSRGWTSELSLQQHVFNVHCNGDASRVNEMSMLHHYNRHHQDKDSHVIRETSARILNGLGTTRTTTGRKQTTNNPKMTMVTGLQIRPALVSRKNVRQRTRSKK